MIQGIRAMFRSHGQCVLDSLRNQSHCHETVVLIDSPETGQDLESVDAFALSHGHFDHWTGAEEILRSRGKIAGDTPFYVGEETFSRRCSLRTGTLYGF